MGVKGDLNFTRQIIQLQQSVMNSVILIYVFSMHLKYEINTNDYFCNDLVYPVLLFIISVHYSISVLTSE